MTGSGGSGILIARKSDGTWSPPSGIMLHTPTLSFIIGVDIYDCVLVITNLAALESVTKPRVTLGEDVGLRSGPSVPLDTEEVDINWKDLGNTVLTYMKARGQQQNVNLNGCLLTERCNENERFYHQDVSQMDILAGNIAKQVDETTPLFEVIKMAEGRTDYNTSIIDKAAAEPAPGDAIITITPKSTPVSPRHAFGIPKIDDPDPFGVLALEMAGLEIREAGSRLRPTSSLFDLNQNPMSPGYSKFGRQSVDTFVSKSNRGSCMSTRTAKSLVTDAGTQTSVGNTPETTPSPGLSGRDGSGRESPDSIPELKEEEDDEDIDYTSLDVTAIRPMSLEPSRKQVAPELNVVVVEEDQVSLEQPISNELEKEEEVCEKRERTEDINDADADDEEDEEEEDEEEPVVFEFAAIQPVVTQVVTSRVIQARGNVVTIAKRVPPPLPKRSPARLSRIGKAEILGPDGIPIGEKSPLRQAHSDENLKKDSDGEQASVDSLVLEAGIAPDVVVLETHHEVPEPAELKSKPLETNRLSHSLSVEPLIDESNSQEDITVLPQSVDNDVLDETSHEQHEAHSSETDDPKIERQGGRHDASDVNTDEPRGQMISIEIPKEDETHRNSFLHEHADLSDSASNNNKHTSSIYTGATEDRWSFDGSSLTTPTSEMRFSITDDVLSDDTPKKMMKDLEQPEAHEVSLRPHELSETRLGMNTTATEA